MPKKAVVKHIGPLRSIRRYCVWCCNGSSPEVSQCPVAECSLWARRFGRGVQDGKSNLKVIRVRCLDCSGDKANDVRTCWAKDCALRRFRMGKNPALKGRAYPAGLRKLNEERRANASLKSKNNTVST